MYLVCIVSKIVKCLPNNSEDFNQALPQGTTIAASKTRRYLRKQGVFCRIAVKKLLLRPQNRKKRLRFAKEH